MFNSFTWVLATFTFVPAQIPFFEKPPLEDAAVLKRPTVVRIVTSCKANYSYQGEGVKEDDQGKGLKWGWIKIEKESISTRHTGTGYLVSPDGYIVTNAHLVAEEECKSDLYAKIISQITKLDIDNIPLDKQKALRDKIDLKDFQQHEQRVYLPNAKGAFKKYDVKEVVSPKPGFNNKGVIDAYGGKDVAVIKIDGISAAPTLRLAKSGEVAEESPVKVIGYPGIGDISEQSFLRASITAGKISAVKAMPNDVKVFQVDVSIAPGSSGSPVLNGKGEVIGMISFYSKDLASGDRIPFAVPTDTILEIVRKSGAPFNQDSLTDTLFREGIDFYQAGDYEGAKAKFDQIQRVFPEHSEIDDYLKKAQSKWNEARDRDRKNMPIVWSLIGASTFAVLGGTYLLLRRRSQLTPVREAVGTFSEPIATQAFSPKLTHFFRRNSTVLKTECVLELKNQQGQTKRFFLDRSEHHLGRDRRWADLFLPDEGWEIVSRQHAKLVREGESYRIYDVRSANKLLLNGKPLDDSGHLLQDSDELQIGHDPTAQATLTYFSNA